MTWKYKIWFEKLSKASILFIYEDEHPAAITIDLINMSNIVDAM